MIDGEHVAPATVNNRLQVAKADPRGPRRRRRYGRPVLAPLGHRVAHPGLITADDVVHRLGCPLRPTGDVLAADVVLWRQRAPRARDRCRAELVTVLYSRPAGDG